MRLTRSVAAAAAVISTAGVCVLGVAMTGAGADTVASAKTRAAELNREVNRLNTEAEVASQRYDAIESELASAVTSSLADQQAAAAARERIARAQDNLDARVQALYASAGSFNLFAVMLGGSGNDAIQQLQVSRSFLKGQTNQLARYRSELSQASDTTRVQQLTTQQKVALQRKAGEAETRINTLLSKAHRELASANATVKRLAAAEQRTATASSVAAFAADLKAQGGSLGTNTTPPNSTAATAIAWAKSRIGDPYVWGGTGPNDFDCSGLTQWSYAHAGIELPRVANEQWFAGPHPALTALEPGDLLFYATDLNDEATIHHVTMYLGNGMMIDAPETGENVQIQPVYLDGLYGATRPWAATAS